jgi:integrase/recombinase XerD
LLAVPNWSTWTGRRDYALFAFAAQTGLRVSELISLQCSDIHLGTVAHVSCLAKGRKRRITPLTSTMVAVLRVWLAERGCRPTDPLFVSKTVKALNRDALEYRLAKCVELVSRTCPSLGQKSITMHVMRHCLASQTSAPGREPNPGRCTQHHPADFQSTPPTIRTSRSQELPSTFNAS